MSSIHKLIREAEKNYTTGDTQISEYVSFSLKDNVDKIEAYLNSKHISGDKDSVGRDKPFFNIVTAAVNVWYRATDIDRANIRIKASKSSDHTRAVLADVKSKDWMRKSGFGVFLNEWGRTLVKYGSAVVKFVEKDGELIPSVVPWNRLIVDSIDFENNIKIEKLYMTPAQLRKNKAYDQDVVESLIDAVSVRKSLSGQTRDNKSEYIELYEIHGELEEEYLTGEEAYETENEKYVQQVHICSFLEGEKPGEYQDFTLYSGREDDPYMITHLIKEEGRVMAIGVVEHLFEAQWMVNHNEKAIKDQLDLASKLIFQTSDPNYLAKNLHHLDTGSVLTHNPNEPLTQVANTSHDITSLMNAKSAWQGQANEAASTPDAIKGNTMPSQTAARQVEALQQESHSLFELMTENKGLAIEDMWRRFVIPFIKKQLDTKAEIVATLDDANIKQIDTIFIPNVAKKRIAEKLKRQMFEAVSKRITEAPGQIDQPDMAGELATVQEEMKSLGNTRYFAPDDLDEKTWKEVFKDLEWEVEVEVTNESHDKLATLTSLTTVFKELAGLGDIENARMVMNKILEETGVFSPMELVATLAPAQPQASSLSPEQLPTQESNTPTTQT